MLDIKNLVKLQKDFFATGKTKDITFRIEKLKNLCESIKMHEAEIMLALRLDLNKSEFESYETEIGLVLEEIRHTIKRLPKWAKTKRVKTPIMHFISSSRIYREPYGLALIIAPWNYPFQLVMIPLIGAIAAGNVCVIKPSEYSAHTANIIEKIMLDVFQKEYIAIVQGDREVNKRLLEEKFDYIFFTGSPQVGRIVMESAAKHLTPVTLELGGKSPCIVDETANIKLAAKRIVWGKFLNAGQTCVAPDYLFVHKKVKNELILEMKKNITLFYGDNPLICKDYPKIVNQKHFDRLLGLMESETVICGGRWGEDTLQIEPTILDNITWEKPVMQEEIFGPLLPIMEFENLIDVVTMIQDRSKPLALYLFTTNKKNERYVMDNISFGGGCINDTMIHLTNPHMPFGGVGESGMGQYHGKNSYDTFTHQKGIIKKSNLVDLFLRYPPFKKHLSILKKFMK